MITTKATPAAQLNVYHTVYIKHTHTHTHNCDNVTTFSVPKYIFVTQIYIKNWPHLDGNNSVICIFVYTLF